MAHLTSHAQTATPGLQAFLDQNAARTLRSGVAIDFGAGGGRDTRALLRNGWTTVHAVDHDPNTRTALQDVANAGKAVVHTSNLRDADIPPGTADVVNAQRVLPFMPDDVAGTLARSAQLLRPGGMLVASFFGPDHTWSVRPRLAVHDADTVRNMLGAAGLEVVQLDDSRETNVPSADGMTVPMWHEIRVQAQRK